MSLMSEIVPYLDRNGMVCPKLADPNAPYGSGNGVMYTSELYTLANMRGELAEDDKKRFFSIIQRCITFHGALNRTPVELNHDQEGPDDYYGLLNACMNLGNTEIPRTFLKCVIMNMGALNNEHPSKWTARSFLIRQPQLLLSMLVAAFPSRVNPLHYAIRILLLPLFVFSALLIATNGMFVDPKEVDTRRLGWHLAKTLSPVSLLCKIASAIRAKMIEVDYGPEGMKVVASRYYEENHPFARYWVE